MMKKINRCSWANGNSLMEEYHDYEWGKPVHNDRVLFEFLTLEGAQAGLSWLTVLKKRKNYSVAFDDWNVKKIINYDQHKIESLLNDSGIIRNKLKVNSVIENAKAFLRIQQEYGSFDRYIWNFVNGKPIINQFKSLHEIPSSTEVSDQMSIALKKQGFKFVGTTICYAFMQAVGMVNDHTIDCDCYPKSST